jgi:hypothetical protein
MVKGKNIWKIKEEMLDNKKCEKYLIFFHKWQKLKKN